MITTSCRKALTACTLRTALQPDAPTRIAESGAEVQVRPEGFEPPTLGSEDRCSIQLSYGREVGICQKDKAYRNIRRRQVASLPVELPRRIPRQAGRGDRERHEMTIIPRRQTLRAVEMLSLGGPFSS